MSAVQIFKDITTEDILLGLEAESKKYTGLYVEMENDEERKYVKDKASGINDLLKVLDRARIDKSKDFKSEVEAEALTIKSRLENANKPFTLLIDEHKAARKKILDDKKAKEAAIELARQKELDHEFAILMDAQWDNDKDKRAQEKADEIERIAEQARQELIAKQKEEQAAKDKEAEMLQLIEDAKIRDADKAEQDRINDTSHRASINNKSVNELVALGVEECQALLVIKLIAANKTTSLQINY